jgi:hypothetical protein
MFFNPQAPPTDLDAAFFALVGGDVPTTGGVLVAGDAGRLLITPAVGRKLTFEPRVLGDVKRPIYILGEEQVNSEPLEVTTGNDGKWQIRLLPLPSYAGWHYTDVNGDIYQLEPFTQEQIDAGPNADPVQIETLIIPR